MSARALAPLLLALAAAPIQAQEVLIIGTPETPAAVLPEPTAPIERHTLELGIDRLWTEFGAFTEGEARAATSAHFTGVVAAAWRPAPAWELRAALRLDGDAQSGADRLRALALDYDESYLRYRNPQRRVTLGAQTVLWGRVDEIPPTDRLSVQDISRFAIDELDDRRRAVPLLRWEEFGTDHKLDLVVIPAFRPAELPDDDSVWYPVDRDQGRLLGIRSDPLLAALVRGASTGDDRPGGAGAGLRFSHSLSGLDYALTVQHTRHSLPYYELDPAVRRALLDGADVASALAAGGERPTFLGRHPYTTILGGDLGVVVGGATLRLEAAWLSDVPVTTRDLRLDTVAGLDWVAGIEFYPGDADTRINLQLAGRHLLDAPPVIDWVDTLSLNGQLESEWGQGRWRGRLRFAAGLNRHDLYLNPEIAYIAREPHEFYLGAHYFDGEDGTFGDFYADDTLIATGWRVRY
ncbi:MAG: hypothetical protein J7D61_11195 [Marichromatium sp.]|uniref:hypothetical protein n=1 Tax=Marichromatium sp. PS1 TaxID=3138932 RepID=UPI001B06B335|nr:hypothetical protein [Marichromatium sp.]